MKRVDREFEAYVLDLQKKLKEVLGRDVSFTETTKLIAKMDSKRIVMLPKRKRKKIFFEDSTIF